MTNVRMTKSGFLLRLAVVTLTLAVLLVGSAIVQRSTYPLIGAAFAGGVGALNLVGWFFVWRG